AGAYEWTTVPLMAGVAWLALLERPQLRQSDEKLLDAALLACLAIVAASLVPLPASIRQSLSPAAAAFERAVRLEAAADALMGPARPLSIDPGSTAWALAVAAAAVALFWCARAAFAWGGVRAVVRAIAAMGLIASAIAIVQHATAPTLLYWHWRPAASSARPYGPFVNRNDLACWLVMAIPLTVGYLIARVRARRDRSGAIDVDSAFDATTAWLVAASCLMLGALLGSLSRSGMTAGAVGLATLVWLSRKRIGRRRAGWLIVTLVAMAAVAAAYVNVGALADRVGDALATGIGGRRAIWRETWAMAKNFWLTGIGAGAYERGMLIYQTSPRQDFYFNHAHNEYLQILAEGGILLAA